MKIKITLFSFLLFFVAFSQNSVVKKYLEAEKIILEAEEFYLDQNYDTVIFLTQKALEKLKLLKKTKNKNIILLEARGLNNIGVIYYTYGNYSKALHFYYKALKIRENLYDNAGLIESYNNIANIYKQQKDTFNAIKLYKKSLRYAEIENNQKEKSTIYNNLAGIYPIESSGLALNYYFKSLKIEEENNSIVEIGKRQQNIAVIYQNLNNFKLANDWYLKSIESKSKTNDLSGICFSLVAIGKLKFEENNIREAEKHALKAYSLAKEIDRTEKIIAASELLYNIYLKQKNYQKALEMLVILTENKEKQIISANETETVKLQTEYEFNKKITADSLKARLEKEALNLKINVEKQKQVGLYILILFTIGFSFLMYNRFKKTNKQKKIIENQKHIVEEKNREITDSINYAKKIQHTLLTNDELFKENLKDYFVLFRPKDIVSGDFYWAYKKDDNFYLASCDSTGHGVPGAFMSLLNISFLNEAVNEKKLLEPNEILNYVRERLIVNIGQNGRQDGMDGTLLRINKIKKEITFAAAYNAPIIVVNNDLQLLQANRMAVGKSPKEKESFTLYSIPYTENCLIYLYSDGYTDQFGGTTSDKGKKLKLKQLQNYLLQNCNLPMEQQGKILETFFDDWKGDFEQVDDMLVIGFKL